MVSFVVPTQNSARTIEACLRSIREQDGAIIEVIVVDNASSDSTPGIARNYADTFISGGPERSAQRNQGAAASRGDYLVFIDSDMILHPCVAQEIVASFTDAASIAALVLPEHVFGDGFWPRCRAIEKECYVGDKSIEAARAFRRESFEAIGGYDETLTGPEDWDLPDRLAASGESIGRISAVLLHDESDLTLTKAYRKKRYYGRSSRTFLARSTPARRARVLRISLVVFALRRLIIDPVHVCGLVVLKSAEMAGAIRGLLVRDQP